MLKIGEIGKFIVKRETDISYTLAPYGNDETTFVFLHFNQSIRRLKIGEIIDAFLYYDNKSDFVLLWKHQLSPQPNMTLLK